jgi:hypothetical protein
MTRVCFKVINYNINLHVLFLNNSYESDNISYTYEAELVNICYKLGYEALIFNTFVL